MGQHETKKPSQVVACKGFWDFMILHETGIWWRRRELNPRPQTLHLKATTCLVESFI